MPGWLQHQRCATGAAFVSLLIAAGVLLLGVLPAAAQPVKAELRATGFPSGGASGCAVRYGQWFPIVVDLSASGSESLSCSLQYESRDIDGDVVTYTERPPPIPPEPGSRRVWVYAALHSAQRTDTLRVVSADGVTLTTVDVRDPERLPSDTLLVLDLSEPAVTLLQQIESSDALSDELGLASRIFQRKVLVSRMSAALLPDRWFGLESVDVVVWDRPDVGGSTSPVGPAQIDALLNWVQQGGQLVLGLGSSWPTLRKSPLGEALRLKSGEVTEEVESLPFFLREFARDASTKKFPAMIPLARVEGPSDPRVGLTLMRDRVGQVEPLPLLTLTHHGAGRIISAAASLRDLSSVPLRGDKLLPRLLDIHKLGPALSEIAGKNPFDFETRLRPLYDGAIRLIEYRQLGSLLLLLALLFVFGYILVATFASWFYLQRRKRTDLSWPLFAGIAVVASLFSLGAVQSTRGCQSVRSISLVDAVADSPQASARVYLGYRSAGRQFDDLELDREPNQPETWLRPLSESPSAAGNAEYATPARYEALSSRGQLNNVLMRATLKQFEGAWSGTLDGVIRGDLTARRDDGRITAESGLQNDLPCDIAAGFLLYLDPRIRDEIAGGVPLRAATQTQGYRPDYLGADVVPPGANVLVVPLGAWKSGARLTELGKGLYADLDKKLSDWETRQATAQTPPAPHERPEPLTLFKLQSESWTAPLDITRALLADTPIDVANWLLLSTHELYWPLARAHDTRTPGMPFSTAGLMDADVTHWLLRNQAVLLLWSDTPGPTQLLRDGRPIGNAAGATLYRVRIPLSYVGNPPAVAAPARPAAPRAAPETKP